MGFRFRLGKHKNKLIAWLLILSILFIDISMSMMQVQASQTVEYIKKTYWDVLNSIANSCGYSMEEIVDPSIDDDLDLKDYAKASLVRYFHWAATNDSELGSFEDINREFYHIVDSSTVFGLKMSVKMFESFKRFFSDVANNTLIGEKVVSDYSDASSLRSYISSCTGGEVPFDFDLSDSSLLSYVRDTNFVVRYNFSDGTYMYIIISCNVDNATFFNTSFSNGQNGHFGWMVPDGNSWSNASVAIEFQKDNWNNGFYSRSYGIINCCYPVREGCSIDILGANGCVVKGTSQELYSPYIKYTSTGSAPAQVPDIIPWSTFPDHEVTDDDTKIYIPVESPDVETPTETPEEPTETPEEPTETPENPDDGDDITNLVPIFPDIDIDIDPDIHLPDDWINPPDIDLDPDVDVDTPSPGGKIPHLQKLKEKFPFCIPFDLVLLFKMLNKKPKAPKWEFKHDFQIGDSKPYTWEVVVDMADYDKYVQIFREGFFLLFLVGLFFVTKKLISWQTG